MNPDFTHASCSSCAARGNASSHVPTLDSFSANEIATYDTDQWVAYDDAKTFALRWQYAQSKCLGGVMEWAMTKDTSDAKYSKALAAVVKG